MQREYRRIGVRPTVPILHVGSENDSLYQQKFHTSKTAKELQLRAKKIKKLIDRGNVLTRRESRNNERT